jgi:hypothetical protein
MGNNYVSIWKDDQFWIRLKDIYSGISGFALYLWQLFDGKNSGLFYPIFSLILISIGLTLDVFVENMSKETAELKKRIFFRFVPILGIASVYFISYHFVNNERSTMVFVLVSYLLLIGSIGVLFKERLNRTDNILKYLFNDTPTLFSKEFFQESDRGKIIVNSILFLGAIAYFFWYIFAKLIL